MASVLTILYLVWHALTIAHIMYLAMFLAVKFDYCPENYSVTPSGAFPCLRMEWTEDSPPYCNKKQKNLVTIMLRSFVLT